MWRPSQEELCVFRTSSHLYVPPAFGASRHIASIILAAMQTYPSIRCVMNVRFTEELLSRAAAVGFAVAGFDRSAEPQDVKQREGSSLEWGTLEAIRSSGVRPDVIFDRGESGKEPMIRILGLDPQDVLNKVLNLYTSRI